MARNVTYDIFKNWNDAETEVSNGSVIAKFWTRPVRNGFYMKEWYVLWKWFNRDATLKSRWSEKQEPLPLTDLPSGGKVALYAEAYSDKADIEVWALFKMKEDVYNRVKKFIEECDFDKFLAEITTLLIAAGAAEGPVGSLASLLSAVAELYGYEYVMKTLVVPFYAKVRIRGKDKQFKTYNLPDWLAWCILGKGVYELHWGFEMDDNAGCDGCIFNYCWGCQEVEEPSLHAAIGVQLVF